MSDRIHHVCTSVKPSSLLHQSRANTIHERDWASERIEYTNVIGRVSEYTNVIGRVSEYTNVIGRPCGAKGGICVECDARTVGVAGSVHSLTRRFVYSLVLSIRLDLRMKGFINESGGFKLEVY